MRANLKSRSALAVWMCASPINAVRCAWSQRPSRAAPQLVEVINEDYADFVSLSTKLVNVDGAVLRMQKPLQELRVTPVTLRLRLQNTLSHTDSHRTPMLVQCVLVPTCS